MPIVTCTVEGCGKEFDAPQSLIDQAKLLDAGVACSDCATAACECMAEHDEDTREEL